MNKTDFINTLSRTYHKAGFKLKKHSPEILIVAGITGTVISAIMACKATTKVSAILEETKEQVDGIHDVLENPVLAKKYEDHYGEAYTVEASKKDLAIIYAQTGLKFVKLYGPSVALGVVSMGCILASNDILRKRNIALAAAYATVDTGFKEYRNRVIERFGKDLDRELKYNIKAKEVEEIVVDEDGKETVVKKTVEVAEINEISDYARFFDEYCAGWTKDPEYNLTFLKMQQSYANKKLQADGHLYLNDVYEMLGIPKTKAGHVVGWIYDEKHPIGDNHVDFGIYDVHNAQKRQFVNGHERSILLDFNVDGNIWELLP